MRTKPALTADDVRQMMQLCLAEAERQGCQVTVAIVDDGGHLFSLERMDGVTVPTVEVAIGKARTAALGKKPTGLIQNRLKDEPVLLKLNNMPMQGGVPILLGSDCLGGIGVSGAQMAQDEEIGWAGAAFITGH